MYWRSWRDREGKEKGSRRNTKLGTHRGAEVADDRAETVKTPTSGSHQQASVKCKIDMR